MAHVTVCLIKEALEAYPRQLKSSDHDCKAVDDFSCLLKVGIFGSPFR